jgi:16S rRNA (adenine1518-N6/adenine1519-N6)-dimethyltransferase
MLPMNISVNAARAKAMGQNFLVNEDVAKAEAVHAEGKKGIEIGPGYGILTKELCRHARHVVAVEKDKMLYSMLKREMRQKNLELINKDFFDATDEELGISGMQIMVANIPYNLSSKVIEWLSAHRMEAVLCLQKEFVDHMLAVHGTGKYSKLSVVCHLFFSVTKMMSVSRGNFSPAPKVDSAIVYMKPRETNVSPRELRIASLLMEHKKKTLRNAIIDSHSYLGASKQALGKISEKLMERNKRVFKMSPEELMDVSGRIAALLGT